MIAKIIPNGTSFKSTLNYILNQEKGTRVIHSEGVRLKSIESVTQSMSTQAMLNSSVTKPVGHIALSFSKQDANRLTNELMVKIAKEYMQKMGIVNTNYLIARHFDKEHPHIHLCYNRIDYNGKTISDKNNRFRSTKIAKELTVNYALYIAKGKENVKTHRLREPQLTKYKLYEGIKLSSSIATNWDDLKKMLALQDISMEFKTKGNTNEIQGVKFSMNDITYSGSKIDKEFSYNKLDSLLRQNQLSYTMTEDNNNDKSISQELDIEEDFSLGASILKTTLNVGLSNANNSEENQDEENEQQKRRTRRR